jgi:hypothetical protein
MQCCDCGKWIPFSATYLADMERGLKTGFFCLPCFEASDYFEMGRKLMWESFVAYKRGVL